MEDFRSGKRNVAEFWIQMDGKFIYISYYAVRDEQGAYRGTIEVTQDLTHLREIQGERRLLDRLILSFECIIKGSSMAALFNDSLMMESPPCY